MQSTPTLTQGEYILSNLRADPLTADNLHRLKNIGSNGQAPVGTRHLTEVHRRSKPQHFGLLRIQLEMLGCAPAGNSGDALRGLTLKCS